MASVMVEQMERSEARIPAANVRVTVDDGGRPRSYYLHVTESAVTVVYDPANRRHLGKTFHGRDEAAVARELARGYKRDGATLADLTQQARALLAG